MGQHIFFKIRSITFAMFFGIGSIVFAKPQKWHHSDHRFIPFAFSLRSAYFVCLEHMLAFKEECSRVN